MENINHFVFDVESIGLHGEGFAVGYVVVDSEGKRIEERIYACPSGNAYGTKYDHEWVNANVPELVPECHTPEVVRETFWQDYMRWKARSDTQFWADCLWPVEARFLIDCVNDDPINRMWEGPYPFHEIATLIYANNLDPLARNERLPDEEPIHNPLHDARQSARLLVSLLSLVQKPIAPHDDKLYA